MSSITPSPAWRWRRRLLIAAAILATLVAGLITEENWRAKRLWENYRAAALARGEYLDYATKPRPVIAEADNFYAAPGIREMFTTNQSAKCLLNFDIYFADPTNRQVRYIGDWMKHEVTDLRPWAEVFRDYNQRPENRAKLLPLPASPLSAADDVLAALSIYQDQLEKLRAASLLPQAQMPLGHSNLASDVSCQLPALAMNKKCAQFLSLHAKAEILANHGAAALADLELQNRLLKKLDAEPYLITFLVKIAICHIQLQPIYDGLARHCWSDAELAQLQAILAESDYLKAYQIALQQEKTAIQAELDNQRLTRELILEDNSVSPSKVKVISLKCVPAAYFYQNQFAICQFIDELAIPLADPSAHRIYPDKYHLAMQSLEAQKTHWNPYRIQTLIILPSLLPAYSKAARIQAYNDLARIACSLERYRLAHQQYPETLTELTPQYLANIPCDVVTGQPLHYQKISADKFKVYSVGDDEKDDGGTVFLTEKGSINNKKGDWVWQN